MHVLANSSSGAKVARCSLRRKFDRGDLGVADACIGTIAVRIGQLPMGTNQSAIGSAQCHG